MAEENSNNNEGGDSGERNSKFYYILNLTKSRIFILSFFLSFFLLITFIIGFSIGKLSKKIDNKDIAKTVSEEEILNDGEVDLFQSKGSIPSSQILEEQGQAKNKNPYIKEVTPYVKSKQNPPVKASPPPRKKKVNPNAKEYYIQVIVTLSKDKSLQILKELRDRKYKAWVNIYKKGNSDYHIVRVGLYTDKKKALKHLRLIQKYGGYKDAFLKLAPKKSKR